MLYVLEMSTDHDIVGTQLANGWPAVTHRANWAAVHAGGLNIPAGATIVVVAHGNGKEIGNAHAGIDITAEAFLSLIHSNMAGGGAPGSVYLSVCGTGIAEFTARVKLTAASNNIWQHTHLFGHHDSVCGAVPKPGQTAWTQIF